MSAPAQGLLNDLDGAGQAPPVEASDGQVAYHLVEGWVRAGRVPDDDALPAAPLTGVFGVYVTVRDNGQLVGRGVALRPDLAETVNQAGPPVDMARLLAEATRVAMADAERTQRRRANEFNVNDPELVQDAINEMNARMLVDVQIGHGLTTVVLPPTAPTGAVFGHFVPGYHGLRLTGPLMPNGDLIWPANALSRNTSPRSQLVQLLDRQGFEQEDIVVVARPSGPQLERFEVIHYAQAGANQPARQLIRGNVVVPRRALDTRGLDGIAERITRHLDGKIEVLNDGTLVLRGPFRPSSNRYDPVLAGLRQGSLACFALMVQGRAAQDRTPGERISRVRSERALSVVQTLIPVANPPGGNVQPISAALLLLALCESPIPVDDAVRDALGASLFALRRADGGFNATPGGNERASRTTEAVITAALASWYAASNAPDPALGETVWRSIYELVLLNDDEEQGARLADLTWLSVAYTRAGPQIANAIDAPDAHEQLQQVQAFFAKQIGLLIEQQVTAPPLMGPDDVSGGYVTVAGPIGAAPDPNWESAMPLAIVSMGLRDEAVVPPNDIYGPVLSAQLGGRFIAQLMITDQNAFYVRDYQAVSGGVRQSLWDNTLSLDCSSMALIALSELQASLSFLEKRDNPE